MTEPQQISRAAAYLLDLTRLMSRAGRGPMTGVDRVEAAYLAQLLQEKIPVFGLIRTSLGFILLDHKGMKSFQHKVLGQTKWGKPDILSRLTHRSNTIRQSVESDLRRLCIARASSKGLSRMFERALPNGFIWLNVGHTNLKQDVFNAVHKVKDARAHIMVHDMIPLEYPQYQRSGTVDKFKHRMKNTSKMADLVIYNSHHSQRSAEQYFNKWGRIPPAQVAHLGVECPVPDPSNLPPSLDLSQPYFVVTGTIEPRKNHALLLDVWHQLALEDKPIPQMLIIGSRGWNNEALFKRLDTKPEGIIELNGLNDAAMATLVKGARAALFPSLAEGFGLPPCEAALLGTTIVAVELEVTREILENIPIYANPLDMYSWVQIVRELITNTKVERSKIEQAKINSSIPTWQDHFNMVLTMT